MRKEYISPELEVKVLNLADVIVTSGGEGKDWLSNMTEIMKIDPNYSNDTKISP